MAKEPLGQGGQGKVARRLSQAVRQTSWPFLG